jgi:hypothetical protein
VLGDPVAANRSEGGDDQNGVLGPAILLDMPQCKAKQHVELIASRRSGEGHVFLARAD